ncbi:cytochrome c3 family protein [Deferrisoma sp.]
MRTLLGLLVGAALGAAPAWAAPGGVAHVTLASGLAQTPSRGCGACHSPEFSLWIRHPHSHFLIDPARDPRLVKARWGKRVTGWIEHVEGRFRRDEVALAYGVLQIQVYFRRDDDGHRLLPAQWNLEARRWEPLSPSLRRVVETGLTWEDGCAGCHTTGYDPTTRTFPEANTGCQACHGDGAAHADTGGREPVLRPSALPALERSALCGACHSRGESPDGRYPFPVGFRAGERLEKAFRLHRPAPDRNTEYFWRGGVERLPFMEYQGFVESRHAAAGLSCTTCHLPHGSDYRHSLRRRSEDICGGCHDRAEVRLVKAHAKHPDDEAGCIDCHMAITNPDRGAYRVRTHSLKVWVADDVERGTVLSSCTSACHRGETGAWARRTLEEWRKP